MNPSPPLPHPRALAHLGDAVYTLWVREEAVRVTQKSGELHRYSSQRAQADTQAKVLELLQSDLTESEATLVKQAQNMPVPAGRRANQFIYRKATALEALIGYWYLSAPEKLPERRQQVVGLLERIFSG